MMSLRLQINLLLATMMVMFVAALGWQQLDSTRRGVREEIQAAHRVATQVLTRVSLVYRRAGIDGMVEFLHQLGRVRANDITLHDDAGRLLYESPPSPYKPGRNAPAWFSALVWTPEEARSIPVPGGHITIIANPSRAVLDGWDDLARLLSVAMIIFGFSIIAIYWLAGRAVDPIVRVVEALGSIGRGEYQTRLPALPGTEGASMSQAFNGMAQAIEDSIDARREAAEAGERLARNRELTQLIQSRIEEERGAIARELHDEMGQALTAIKSLGQAIAQRAAAPGDATVQAARLIVETTDHLYEVVHGLIPRLRPLALDNFGLADALEDLVGDWRPRHPRIEFSLSLRNLPEHLDDARATAVYRIVQEALTNSIRHAGASRVDVEVQGGHRLMTVRISDNGRGLGGDTPAGGHYGVIGMRERTVGLGGSLDLLAAEGGGLSVVARIPLEPPPDAAARSTAGTTAASPVEGAA